MEHWEAAGQQAKHEISLMEGAGALEIRRGGGSVLESGDWLGAVCMDSEESERREDFWAHRFHVEAEGGGLRFTAHGGCAEFSGAWKLLGRGLELHISLKNAGAGVVHAAWARFGGLRMPPDSAFALPHGAGFTVPLPGLAEGECVKLHYPVFCSMQWLDVFTQNRGIYLGVCDERPRSKVFIAGRKQGAPYMEVCFSDLQLKPGERCELPPIQLMAHDGDWRVGAAHYRGWFESVFKKPEAPRWCRELPVWAWAICKKQHADKPDRLFSQLPGHRKTFAGYGISALQISGYMEKGHDALFPDYEAGPCMGGEKGLRSAMNRIHADGGRLALYTNGRLADPESSVGSRDDWKDWCVSGLSLEHLRRMNGELRFGAANESLHSVAWDRDGTCYKERYDEVEFAVMCPSSASWRRHFIGKLEDLAKRYEPDGIYLDQVCGAWGLACYNPGHGHGRPCDAWCGYMGLLEELRKTVRGVVPDMYLATEGVNDILGVHIDIFQAHNWGFRFGLPKSAEPSPDIFITAHPDYLLYLGPVFKDDRRELRRAFAYGRGFDIALDDIDGCEEGFLKELDFAVQSRRALCPGLLSAAPLPVLCGAGIRCFRYALPGDRTVVLGSAVETGTDIPGEIRIPPLAGLAGRRLRISTPYGNRELKYGGAEEIGVERDAGMWMIVEV
jgi:hypothetical protein